MIRKTIILVLTLAAVWTGALLVVSFWYQLHLEGSFLRPTVSIVDGVFRVTPPVHPARIPLAASQAPRMPGHYIRYSKEANETQTTGTASPRDKPCGPLRKVLSIGGLVVEVSLCGIHTDVWDRLKIRLPLWIVIILFSIYPMVAAARGPVRRVLRRRRGRCVKCAYDLTGLNDPRCPECGTHV